ncbi:hypothetical protein Acr_04g0005990 [Actinidia rufa]|uniref:Retrovirus-related Pol polyprotein from transposon TNT 1-94-like beta-barrel domain-containing protein n=1 Tax=Actinidia rufa TaxID=165716 RepID=A0A7J0EHB4_9ERIC|nr:hypothetical protein Acr_04g0005990 [Actinidia rufa]
MVDDDESDVLLVASEDGKLDWVLNSGSAYHLCRDREVFSIYAACKGRVWMAKNTASRVVGKGSVWFRMADERSVTLTKIGGALVRHRSSDISKEIGQGKQPLHRGTQSKRKGTWEIRNGEARSEAIKKDNLKTSDYPLVGWMGRLLSPTHLDESKPTWMSPSSVAKLKPYAEELDTAHVELDKTRGKPGVLNGWLACLGELGMSADHPAWSATKPLVAYSDLPESYLPILLPGFDEDEYANRSVKDDESDGGTDVEDVEATKELEARAKCSPRFG